ncbi:hypothetical protein F9L33_14270 [Amylibacter sp. SFDW26]|uniref:hypothetical protein n=1 Tax=Amylibacter sp. SFDW26 TaxID=2652722 RepID=UPI0012620B7E|nr:hypothetical protein [Amylibacter sp. SFDW26]KAB7610460.1 hypothetical protein F9L33_14270 [Amylibacter sp. SFDW26]
MALSDWFKNEGQDIIEQRSGPAQVGWMLTEAKSGVVYYTPERVRSVELNKKHAKSASRCPAIINMESRYFAIRVPFDMHLRFVRGKDGKPALRNMMGEASPVRGSVLSKKLHVTSEVEWRHKDRPTIQVSLPYIFIADEPTYMTQLDAFMHYDKQPKPGTIFGGRFPIHNWPRPLMWAFEWHDIQQDLILKRGDPWFYVQFETTPQDRAVSLVEAENTPELAKYLEHISASVNYVNQSFSLFKEAERARPKTLLTPVARK